MSVYQEYPEDRAKSPMLKQINVCDGEAEGHECVHYWRQASKEAVMNPQDVAVGRFQVVCTLVPGKVFPMGEAESEAAVYCNRYENSGRKYESREDLVKRLKARVGVDIAPPQPASKTTPAPTTILDEDHPHEQF